MFVVDAQVHIGEIGGEWVEPPVGGLSRVERRSRRLLGHALPDERNLVAAMERVGVNAAVLVPLSATMADPEDDSEPCLAAARRRPDRFAVMGRVDPSRPAHEDILKRWRQVPEILGVRVTLRDPSAIDAKWLWAALESQEMPVMINAPGSMDYIGSIASAYPDLAIVVDHLGFAGMDQDDLYDDLRPHLGTLLGLAQFENVAVKASGLPAVVTECYPFPLLKSCLFDVVRAFGSKRVFWGSNLSRQPCRYDQIVSFFATELDFLTDEERADIMGAGIIGWLKWRKLEEAQ